MFRRFQRAVGFPARSPLGCEQEFFPDTRSRIDLIFGLDDAIALMLCSKWMVSSGIESNLLMARRRLRAMLDPERSSDCFCSRR